MISQTSKSRLQNEVFPALDRLFGLAHPEDRTDLCKEIREYLTRIRAQSKESVHDKHSNAATSQP
jgi:hypothetical protein